MAGPGDVVGAGVRRADLLLEARKGAVEAAGKPEREIPEKNAAVSSSCV